MISPQDVVLVVTDETVYPDQPPFDPSSWYPEYRFETIAEGSNAVYGAVRQAFADAGLDHERFGTPGWNPLGSLMTSGEFVLIKPNLVKEAHPRDPDGWRYVLTHGSVIRAVVDFVFMAVGPTGRVAIADAPQTDSSFSKIVDVLGLDQLQDFYGARGLDLELIDLRNEEWVSEKGVIVARRRLPGDPRGGIEFDLGDSSEFVGHRGTGRYYGADYDSRVVNDHHRDGHHQYLLSGSAMQADVVFSLPKLKTHKKAGVTLSMKNLVGVNADKNWLPHHSEGTPSTGGDEHPGGSPQHRIERWGTGVLRWLAVRLPTIGTRLLRVARRAGTPVFGDTEEVVRSGNWWGNDTIWRTCLDLNKIVAYGQSDGSLRPGQPEHRRRHLVLVDGIVAGQGNGPMNPDPLPAGVILFGTNPPSVDAAATVLMGFDPEKVPIVRQAFSCSSYPLSEWGWRDVHVIAADPARSGALADVEVMATLRARPHFAWRDHIELDTKVPTDA